MNFDARCVITCLKRFNRTTLTGLNALHAVGKHGGSCHPHQRGSREVVSSVMIIPVMAESGIIIQSNHEAEILLARITVG